MTKQQGGKRRDAGRPRSRLQLSKETAHALAARTKQWRIARTNPLLSEEDVVGALLSETTLSELKPLLVRLTMFSKSQEAREDAALSAEHTLLSQQVELALAQAGFILRWDQNEQRYQITLQ